MTRCRNRLKKRSKSILLPGSKSESNGNCILFFLRGGLKKNNSVKPGKGPIFFYGHNLYFKSTATLEILMYKKQLLVIYFRIF